MVIRFPPSRPVHFGRQELRQHWEFHPAQTTSGSLVRLPVGVLGTPRSLPAEVGSRRLSPRLTQVLFLHATSHVVAPDFPPLLDLAVGPLDFTLHRVGNRKLRKVYNAIAYNVKQPLRTA